jgi:hypothetical protein
VTKTDRMGSVRICSDGPRPRSYLLTDICCLKFFNNISFDHNETHLTMPLTPQKRERCSSTKMSTRISKQRAARTRRPPPRRSERRVLFSDMGRGKENMDRHGSAEERGDGEGQKGDGGSDTEVEDEGEVH